MVKSFPKGWFVETEQYRPNNPNDGWTLSLYHDGKKIMSGLFPTVYDLVEPVTLLNRLIDQAEGGTRHSTRVSDD